MFCHGSIYFCGFVTIGGEVCSAKDAPKLALGVARMAIRAAILRPFVVGSEQLLIYILLDAAAIRQLIPERAWSVALPVYYLAAAAFVLLAIRGFFSQKSEAVPQILRCAGGLTERQSQNRYDGYRPCSFGRSEAVYLYPYRKPIDLQINRKKSNLISKIHNVNDCKLSKPTKNFFWRLHS